MIQYKNVEVKNFQILVIIQLLILIISGTQLKELLLEFIKS